VPAFPRSGGTVSGTLGSSAEAIEAAVEGDRFLRAVKGVWDDHIAAMMKIKAILGYMVRTYHSSLLTFLGQGVHTPEPAPNSIRCRPYPLPLPHCSQYKVPDPHAHHLDPAQPDPARAQWANNPSVVGPRLCRSPFAT
jgi:hypothetical protein